MNENNPRKDWFPQSYALAWNESANHEAVDVEAEVIGRLRERAERNRNCLLGVQP